MNEAMKGLNTFENDLGIFSDFTSEMKNFRVFTKFIEINKIAFVNKKFNKNLRGCSRSRAIWVQKLIYC